MIILLERKDIVNLGFQKDPYDILRTGDTIAINTKNIFSIECYNKYHGAMDGSDLIELGFLINNEPIIVDIVPEEMFDKALEQRNQTFQQIVNAMKNSCGKV